MNVFYSILGIFLGLLTNFVYGSLLPEEVAVIATAGSEDSLNIARFYVTSRKIPPRNVFLLPKKYPETISREVWNREIRPELKGWLKTRPTVRCLVCCWDVPLRIGGYPNDAVQVAGRIRFLEQKRKEALHKIGRILQTMDAIAPTDESRKAASERSLPDNLSTVAAAKMLEGELRNVQKRMAAIPKEERTASMRTLQNALQAAGGLRGFYSILEQRRKSNDPLTQQAAFVRQLDLLKTTLQARMSALRSLERLPESTSRDGEMLRILEICTGVVGTLQWMDGQMEMTRKNESAASFDSELSMIGEEETPLIRWLPNYLSFRTQEFLSSGKWEEKKEEKNRSSSEMLLPGLEEIAPGTIPKPLYPVMMVARLEAPTVDCVLQRIQEMLATEQVGLEGAIYLDARNPRPGGTPAMGSYEKMDQSLHDLAARLKEHTSLEVHLDAEGGLFQKKDCPSQAALYCGWYSLGKYVDAIRFAPGAVAYHTASMEAESLKSGTLWCPQLLQHGAAVTLGPVFEPYLSAFPEPDEFYSLVLTGKYTMVECYYLTKPFNSWAMTFVGDPLYTPYKRNPALKLEDLPETLKTFLKIP
ncbi:MAG: TIGR03790 family protein [Planctomycetia bacterium]|nr:TIGR03790 family protein [Planctomycetia bacterium]